MQIITYLYRQGHVIFLVTMEETLISMALRTFREFWELDIVCDGRKYQKTDFDAVNSSLILKEILDAGKSPGFALVLPQDQSVLPVIVIECLVSLLMLDILEARDDLLAGLEEDDAVGLVVRDEILPAKFKEAMDTDGDFYYVLETGKGKNKCTYKIPKDQRERIQPFSATGRRQGRRMRIGGEAVEKAFRLPKGGILGIQKSKLAVVGNDKSDLIEFLRSLEISGTPFEELFPMANYTSADAFYSVGRNPLDRDPVLAFVSNPSVAADLAVDGGCRTVLMEGGAKLKRASGDISYMRSKHAQTTVIGLLAPNDRHEIDGLHAMGFRCWLWSREDFGLFDERPAIQEEDEHPFALHDNLLVSLADATQKQITVPLPPEIENTISTISELLRKIDSRAPDSRDADSLLARTAAMFYVLTQLPAPLKDFDDVLSEEDPLKNTSHARLLILQEAWRESFGTVMPSDLKPDVSRLFEAMFAWHEFLGKENPKAVALKKFLEGDGGKASVVCRRRDHARALRISGIVPEGGRILEASVIGGDPEPSLVFTGWFGSGFAERTILSPVKESSFLFYPHEMASFRAFENRRRSGYISKYDAETRRNNFGGKFAKSAVPTPEGQPLTADIEDLLGEITKRFGPAIGSDAIGIDEGEEKIAAFPVVFDEDIYTYLSPTMRVARIDRAAGTIRDCKLDDLQIGDELVFIEGARDLFDELIKSLHASASVRALADRADAWRKALLDFVQTNRLSLSGLADVLAKNGCKRGLQTLKGWLEGQTIAPSEQDYQPIDAIATLTHDPLLCDDIAGIKAACRSIRSMHIKAGHLLLRRIRDATMQSKQDYEGLDEDVIERIEEYARKSRILSIEYIADVPVNVPLKMIGCLIDR